jgi:multidrug efflux pump subunit AcrA (membrane-fusion protein)
VRTGDLIARIAPPNSTLQIKALVAIRDIGRVDIGQRVHVRVSACPYTDYGTLEGTVTAISPDAIMAQDVGRIYGGAAVAGATGYEVTARPDGLVLADGVHLCDIQAGMEGRADIVTTQETVLKFLLRKARLSADI